MGLTKYIVGACAAGACYVGLSGPGAPRGDRFAIDLATARARLSGATHQVSGTGLGKMTVASDGEDGDALRVTLKRRRGAAIICRVRLVARAPAETEARTDCAQPQIADAQARDLGDQLFGLIVREHVAAAIEARGYDGDRVTNGVLAFITLNGPKIMALAEAGRARAARDGDED